ncbi:hypothetical protein FHS29_001517 [Saccharothrix tamanrassetensis]|uniref:Uncharacterized protein n=1 Tax=Saccharothrix tamanrassetensis TaxID=1051531 RepID=A0A841CFL2_9PSEU|nr:hypothetical protein [Saccharothrix tamanrassetensis]MBB5954947.1 hypothetical protein [Saccharothrix tamanrassetensis]
MQRPTTSGRRHNRAGSVSVAELIRKQPAPVRIPFREQAANRAQVADLLGEPAHQAAPRPSRRAARLAGLATGAVVLLASVAAASILASHRADGPARPSVPPPAEISGSSALRPDVLSAELGGIDHLPAPVPPAPLAADVPVDMPLEVVSDEPPDTEVVPPREAATRSKPQLDVVRHFYELLPAKPSEAAQLLTPELVGGNAGEFVAAWGRVQAITIESTALRPDGTVHAVVSMQELSGRWMRVEQLFWLTDTSRPRIVGTQVLSAQRS